MENTQDFLSEMDGPKKLPQMLNVLTILTFVGCGFAALSTLLMPMGCKMLDNEAMLEKLKPEEIEHMQITCSQMPLHIGIAIVGAVLCLFGALQMRKLKQTGFMIYLAGQIIPIVATIALLGFKNSFYDWKVWVGFGVVALFIGLYASQRKHLVN